ncbi:HDIG domain-containing metalloprotein [Salinarimonas rosea]|uniref:HDIG domain-containing metalloprotein n=1 Tax=Salinarimonas rosea TaxID=552063 RepID=UPI0003FD621D|nr:HDIG domain-containing metalloprotein [Salinarimonas rosea]
MIAEDRARALLEAHLGGGSRVLHSETVARLMGALARDLGEDARLWTLVGLLHDLDDRETASDRTRHGVLAAEWLRDDLPPEGREAIAAHDHRTGRRATTRLAACLRLCDAFAIAAEEVPAQVLAVASASDLRAALPARPYLADMILALCVEQGFDRARLAAAHG